MVGGWKQFSLDCDRYSIYSRPLQHVCWSYLASEHQTRPNGFPHPPNHTYMIHSYYIKIENLLQAGHFHYAKIGCNSQPGLPHRLRRFPPFTMRRGFISLNNSLGYTTWFLCGFQSVIVVWSPYLSDQRCQFFVRPTRAHHGGPT